MKLLLTGATGFVGRNLLLAALAQGRYDQILTPVRSREKLVSQFRGDGFPDLPPSIVPILASAPKWELGELPEVDHVVHLAGVMAGRSREDYATTNVEGTLRLLSQLSRGPRVLILSSQSAAGPCGEGEEAKREDDLENPVTWYGQSKLEMERKVEAAYSHLDYLFLRPPMILGARDQASLPLFKMAKYTIRLKPGFRPKYYSFISVRDLVGAIFAALDSTRPWSDLKNRRFFVAQERPISDDELIGNAATSKGVLLKVPQPFIKLASSVIDRVPAWREAIPNLSADRAREIWPDRWVISPASFQEAFDWSPQQDLPSTMEETRGWYLRTGQL